MMSNGNSSSPCRRSTYDIIIAGGGTAGCVLATRLSEVSDLNILVLEAGSNRNDDMFVKIPGMYGQAIENRETNWDYRLAPQTNLAGDRRPTLARGKGLGGSSLINVLSLLYPSKAGCDAWAEIGNEGWDWDALLPYIKKFQTFHEPSEQAAKDLQLDYVDRKAQGVDGPIQVTYDGEVHPLDKAWIEAFHNLGYNMRADTVSGRSTGGYQIVNTIDPKTRERSHAGNAYLATAINRPNLEVITGAFINKLVFTTDDDTNPRASGIEFKHDGKTYTAHTSGELILCGGSVASPNILERSGIGNPHILQDLGIKPIVDNKNVGENLHDHFLTGVSFEVKDSVQTLDLFRDPAYVGQAMEQYRTTRSGPLSVSSPSFAYMPLLEEEQGKKTSPETTTNGFKNESLERKQPSFQSLLDQHLGPDPESKEAQTYYERATRALLASPSEASASLALLKVQMHLDKDLTKEIFDLSTPGNYMTICIAPSHPLSRGSCHIVSSDPTMPPTIDPKFYSHPLDKELIARHLQFFPRLISTEPLASLLKPPADGRRMIPEWAAFDTSEDTKLIMRHCCMSMQHPVGTCAMLPKEKGGVVDTKLRVYGVKGLRVCDASVIPIIPRGTLMCAVYAFAEKAADIIKEDFAARK